MNSQLSLFNQFEHLSDFQNNDKIQFLKLIDYNIDFQDLIPLDVLSLYYSQQERKPYLFTSMCKAFIVKNIFGYESVSKLIDLLHASPFVRNFCGFHKIPHKSKFSRFKTSFFQLFEQIFNNMVNLTEPICRKMGENFASHLIYDTSGIIPYVKENNDKFFNKHLKKVKKLHKDKSIN